MDDISDGTNNPMEARLSVSEARSLLFDEDIRPMTETEDGNASDEQAERPESRASDAADADRTSDESASAHEGDEDPKRSFAEDSVGLGVDIVEIDRMRALLSRSKSFARRTFSEAERAYCDKKANPATHYALRFAAKEAVVKALGTGFADGIWVNDIEVVRAKNGKPSVALSGRALEVAREQGVKSISISLSYTHIEAVACAMAITESAIKASEKRKDPMEELARQFKETRGMLDEL